MRILPTLAVVGSLQFGLSGRLDCHVYAITGPKGTVLIDAGAGTDSAAILKNLEQDLGSRTLEAILITHAHADHFAGAAELRQLTGCKVIAPAQSRAVIEYADEVASGLTKARVQGVYPQNFQLTRCPVDTVLEDGQGIDISGFRFKTFQVRGHSDDSLCYLLDLDGCQWLFTGDVVFYGGTLGVINADGSSMEGYRTDLSKLQGLGVDGLFPGHGLFTLRDGQRHIDLAVEQSLKGFLPRQIGQGDIIF
jgi:hydroxyacylglutathione hydrolase